MFGVRRDEVAIELERRLVSGPPRSGSDLDRWLAALSVFDKAQGWFGFRSCARWLAARCSMTQRRARTYVRVARKLEELPRVERALHDGRMSYAKTAIVCRVATADSEKGVLLAAVSTRDDDFALVIAAVEATRRRRALVEFDPTKDEGDKPARWIVGGRTAAMHPCGAVAISPRDTHECIAASRGPPCRAAIVRPCRGPRPLRSPRPEGFVASGNRRSRDTSAIRAPISNPRAHSVPFPTPCVTRLARSTIAADERFNGTAFASLP